jgi:hypothetical protein
VGRIRRQRSGNQDGNGALMLGHSTALKGCATRPGKPASALDRDAAAKQMAVIPLWQNGHQQQNSD